MSATPAPTPAPAPAPFPPPPGPDNAIRPLPALGPATLLRALGRRSARIDGRPVPDTHFRLDAVDLQQLGRYRRAFGFPETFVDDGHAAIAGAVARVPLTWWYLLAQRAQVATLLQPAFPFRLAGTVHAANAIEAFGAPVAGRALRLETCAHLRSRDDGAVHVDLETLGVQDGRPLFACRSSYLVRRGVRRARAGAAAGPTPAHLTAIDAWRLAPSSGRAYAALSGDWNPIHLWRWSARLMGLPDPIIHGMHTLATACAALERAGGRPVVRLDARFKAPAALGSDLELGADLDGACFAVRRTDDAQGRIVVDGGFVFG